MTNLQAQKQLVWIFKRYTEAHNASDEDVEAITMAISALSRCSVAYRNANDDILNGSGLEPLSEGNPTKLVRAPIIPTKKR